MPRRAPLRRRLVGDLRAALARAAVPPRCPVAVAWSGGPDSGAVLGGAWLLARDRGAPPVALHVDHGLRPDSGAEAAVVARFAARRALPVRVERIDLVPGPNLAARARAARYAALARMARRSGAAAVLLGHTATDRAESLLMGALRSGGVAGLGAMAPVFEVDGVPFVRPLLAWTRSETAAAAASFAREMGLPIVEDPTNEDRRHLRAALRAEVLPVLRRFRPAADRALARAAEMAGDAAEAVAVWAGREIERRRTKPDGGLSVAGWRELPRAVRAEILLGFLGARGRAPGAFEPTPAPRRHGSVGPTIRAIDRAVLRGRTGARFSVFGGRTVCLVGAGGALRLEWGPGGGAGPCPNH